MVEREMGGELPVAFSSIHRPVSVPLVERDRAPDRIRIDGNEMAKRFRASKRIRFRPIGRNDDG
jgi:hypothetical protein